jgi:heterotetrameric sarcosine oxidase gamma subunit
MSDGTAELRCTLEVLPAARMVEFVFFDPFAGARGADSLPAPGGARRGADGHPVILHFAPGRYLLPDPSAELDAWVAAAAAQGAGTAVEVEGKWAAFELSGPDSARLLSCSLDVAAVLESRDCAAVVLFDCPAVLTATATGCYLVYVKASYAADFSAAIERLRASSGVA